MPRAIRISLFSILALLLSSCALSPLAVPVALSGGTAGIDYTFTNIAYKTISRPEKAVEEALYRALRKMDIKVTKREASDGKVDIDGETPKLDIYISLENITPTVTKISVDAVHALIFKDKSTAAEIIVQTEKALR